MSAKKHYSKSVPDPYRVLGIRRNATDLEIREAFRKFAKEYHPDVNPGDDEAESKFKRISEAYALLTDPEQKKRYDTTRKKDKGKSRKTAQPPHNNTNRWRTAALLCAIFVSGAIGLLAAEFFGAPTPNPDNKPRQRLSQQTPHTAEPKQDIDVVERDPRSELAEKLKASQRKSTQAKRIAETELENPEQSGNIALDRGPKATALQTQPQPAISKEPEPQSPASEGLEPEDANLGTPEAEVAEPELVSPAQNTQQALVDTPPQTHQEVRPTDPQSNLATEKANRTPLEPKPKPQAAEAPTERRAVPIEETRKASSSPAPQPSEVELAERATAPTMSAQDNPQEFAEPVEAKPVKQEPEKNNDRSAEEQSLAAAEPALPDTTDKSNLQTAHEVPANVPPPSRNPVTDWTTEHKVTRAQSAFPPQKAPTSTNKSLSRDLSPKISAHLQEAGKSRRRHRPWHQHLWDAYFESHCTEYDERRLECRPPTRAFRIKVERYLKRSRQPAMNTIDVMNSWLDFRYHYCRRMLNGYLMCRKPWV